MYEEYIDIFVECENSMVTVTAHTPLPSECSPSESISFFGLFPYLLTPMLTEIGTLGKSLSSYHEIGLMMQNMRSLQLNTYE